MRKPLGVVLAGGRSRRFGVDKARVVVDGEPLVVRTARVVGAVLEVAVVGDRTLGPLFSGWSAPPTFIDDPREGPLGAVVAAWRHFGRPLVVVACDLPRLDVATVVELAVWTGSARIPELAIGGEVPRRQWLCAHYGTRALQHLETSWNEGERSIGRAAVAAMAAGLTLDDHDGSGWDPACFADADTPDALAAIVSGEGSGRRST